MEVINIQCRNCGNGQRFIEDPNIPGNYKCAYCRSTFKVETSNDVMNIPSNKVQSYINMCNTMGEQVFASPDRKNKALGLCYLRIKQYPFALASFQRAIKENFSDSDTLFYCAIAQLKGKEATWLDRFSIQQAEKYLDSAISVNAQKGIYYLLYAYIKYAYYEKNFFMSKPDYKYYLDMANTFGVSEQDKINLFLLLNVKNPF